MPPKNSIRLDPGKIYYSTPEGFKPLGPIQEVKITEESELDILGETPRCIIPESREFTVEATVPEDMMLYFWYLKRRAELMRIAEYILDNYPNRRVVHLATKHGDPLVRKKNQKRICRYYNFKV